MSEKSMKEYFDSLASNWDDHHHNHDIKKLERIADIMDIKPGQKVIDIACGTGIMFPFILDKNPSELVGIDLSEQMLKMANEKFNDSRLRTVAVDILNFDETGFDRAILYNAYPHLEDKEGLSKKLYYLLAPGGRFVVAHSAGKDKINAVHERNGAHLYSSPLMSVEQELKHFNLLFKIDVNIDTDNFYAFSGVRQ